MSPPTESSVPPGTWRRHLLGVPSLTNGGASHALPETAAVALAYVAMEGQTSRAVLSALRWPGSPEATAHNNLRQLKRRLRLACAGTAPLEGDEPELARWLEGARIRVEGWRRVARTAALVRSEAAGDVLELPGVERHAERLARYTGGNPLYVVETVKYLWEQGLVEGEWPERPRWSWRPRR